MGPVQPEQVRSQTQNFSLRGNNWYSHMVDKGLSLLLLLAASALVSLVYPRGEEGREVPTEHAVAVIRRQTGGTERTCTVLVSTGGRRGRLLFASTPYNSCDTETLT